MQCNILSLNILTFLLYIPSSWGSASNNDMPYPQIYLQPEKQSVKREISTSIKCGASGGIGSLTYSFSKGLKPKRLIKVKDILGTPSEVAEYLLPSVDTDDRGYYQCTVTDEAGIKVYSNVIYIDVIDNFLTPPDDLKQEDRVLMSTTQMHVLKCTMLESSPPAWPRWFKDGNLISVDDPNMFVSYGIGKINDVSIEFGDLVLFGVSYPHTAVYKCASYNYALSVQFDVKFYNVTVSTSGDIGTFSSTDAIISDLTINAGEKAFLFCAAIGSPSPEVKFVTMTEGIGNVTDQVTRLVVISEDETKTPGDYFSTCKIGERYLTAKIRIVEPPFVSVDSVKFSGGKTDPIIFYESDVDRHFTISCGTENADSPTKTWLFNGQAFQVNEYQDISMDKEYSLVSRHIRPQNSGVYQCNAYRDGYSVYKTQIVIFKEKLTVESLSPTLREMEHKSKTLSCTFRGSPIPKMEWLYNSMVIEDSDQMKIENKALIYPYISTLLIRNVTIDKSGTYECKASNYIPPFNGKDSKVDSKTSSLVLKVVAPVKVTTPNTTVLSFANKNLVLECTVYGEPKPSIPTWKHEKIEIRNGTAAIISVTKNTYGYTSYMIIKNVTLNNQGNYTCSSSNYIDTEQKASVTITVPVISPVSISAPKLVQVERNTVEVLECNATSHPISTNVSWYFNNQEISTNISSKTWGQTLISRLSVVVRKPEDAGTYTCKSSNRYKDKVYYDSKDIVAEFVSPVEIQAAKSEVIGIYGATLTLTCYVKGYPLPDSIRWQTSDKHLVDNKFLEIRTFRASDEGTLTSELRILKVTYSSEQSYECTASNWLKGKDHTASDEIGIVVEYPVKVASKAPFAYNGLGKPVDIPCMIEGKPLPSKVIWTFSGNPGQSIATSQYYAVNDVSLNNQMNSTLTINSLEATLIGDYTCTAENVVNGTSFSDKAVVTVDQYKRVIVSVDKTVVNSRVTSWTNLTCYGEGVPPPGRDEIMWEFKNKKLNFYSLKHRIDIKPAEDRIFKIISILQISNTQLSDQGVYTCTFRNKDKTDSSTKDFKAITLNVEVPVQVAFDDNATVEMRDGDKASLTCKLFGKPPPQNITWIRTSNEGKIIMSTQDYNISTYNTSVLKENMVSELMIRSMSIDLEDTYECRAENTVLGEKIEKSVFKKVIRVENVQLTPKANTVTARVGKDATLVCYARGVPTPDEVLWYSCGDDRNSCTRIDTEEYKVSDNPFFDQIRKMYVKVESTLYIKTVRWQDKGIFKCIGRNTIRGQTLSDTAYVILDVGQEVSINTEQALKYQTLIGEEPGTIQVQMYGYPPPNVTWLHNGVPIGGNSSMPVKYITMEPYSGVTQVMVSKVGLSHGGTYEINATNTVHNVTFSTSFTVDVTVNYKPRINLTDTAEVLEMTTEKVPCIARAIPIPSDVKWFYKGRDIETSPLLHSKYTLEDATVDEAGAIPVMYRSLIIKQARLQDAGEYTCQVSNIINGRIYRAEKVVNILVVSAVVVTLSDDVVYDASIGEPMNLTCSAIGYPTPKRIMWYINGTLIRSDENTIIHHYKENFKERRSELVVNEVSYDSLGKYECASSNIVLGIPKDDKAVITVQQSLADKVDKPITTQEMLIIAVLAVIIIFVIFVVIIVLYCRRRKKKKQKEMYNQIAELDDIHVAGNGVDKTLRADKEKTGLIQLDPNNSDAPYKDVDYIELDPAMYRSDHSQHLRPMPRKKRAEYAKIEHDRDRLI